MRGEFERALHAYPFLVSGRKQIDLMSPLNYLALNSLSISLAWALRRCWKPAAAFLLIAPVFLSAAASQVAAQGLKNAGFESASPAEFWTVDADPQKDFSIRVDRENVNGGQQSLLLTADKAIELSLRQTIFLPVGTLWRLSVWTRAEMPPNSDRGPQVEIEAPAGSQAISPEGIRSGEWERKSLLFRVPSPGKITVHLIAFRGKAGKVWFDDVRLEPAEDSDGAVESVNISNERLGKRPIDLMQGGQFIEPLCHLTASMIAQQVESTTFENEPAWAPSYKRETDKPYRPWYPDGSVHLAKYSLDTDGPFVGKQSQKIELPAGQTWAGISQDGFYLESGHSYRLRLHMRGAGNVAVRASLHGDGEVIAGPISLGSAGETWGSAEVALLARRSSKNATLTIEFEGPGTLWLDRVYLIDKDAVLGIWRSDVVKALKAMNPGVIRFGGSTIETFDWDKTLGDWDTRQPYETAPWSCIDSNFAGVEEFVQLARYVDAEPLICVRWTGRTPADAAAEVEYFNGSAETAWGRVRARNGHPEPYHVKFWQIGNEVGGADYDSSVKAFADAMKGVDSSIKLLSSFPSAETLKLGGGSLDYLCPHQYSMGDLLATEEDLKTLQNEIARDSKGKDVRVAVTEWNTTAGDMGLGRGILQTLGNALSTSRYLNLLHRYSDLVQIANRSNLSDSFGSGVLQPGAGWLYLAPTYYSQNLYQRAAGSFPVRISRSSSLPGQLQEPDLSVTLSGDGKTLRIYGVNSTAIARKIAFLLQNSLAPVNAGEAFVLGDSTRAADSEAMNTRDAPNRVSVASRKITLRGKQFEYSFAPYTVTLLELHLGEPNRSARRDVN
jgi:alpha-N-arabinofuranosidase